MRNPPIQRLGRWLGVGLIAVLTGGTLVATGAVGSSGGSGAGDHSAIQVSSTSAVSFNGVVDQNGRTGPEDIPGCAATNCDRVTMKVDLPNRTWRNPGGVQVTITWDQLFNDIVNLYVYKDGGLVGISDAIVTTFQSVRLNTNLTPDSTPNGTYDIYLAYAGYTTDFGQAPTPKIKYKGWAQVQYEVPEGTRSLIPEVLPLPPEFATFNHPPAIFGDEPALDTIGCFSSERDEQGARTCLRIEQRMWSVNGRNRGPVEIWFAKPTGEFPATLPAFQRIYRADGTHFDRPAGVVVAHGIHGHYHYTPYSHSVLRAIGPDGRAVGEPLAEGIKNGFCLADTDVIAQKNEQYVDPMTYTAPDCLEPRCPSIANPQDHILGPPCPVETPAPGTEYFVMGEGPGNGDTYDWDLPDQYLEVTGVPDGTYLIETRVDPDKKLLEANPDNNCIAVKVQLTGMGTSTPRVRILGPGPVCRS